MLKLKVSKQTWYLTCGCSNKETGNADIRMEVKLCTLSYRIS